MTTTPRIETAPPTVEKTGQRTLLIRYDGQTFAVGMTAAEQLARALREAVYTHAPELQRVTGYDDGSGPTVHDPDQAAAMIAEGWDVTEVHGLACPHPDCGHIAWDDHYEGITVVDEDERMSTFGYLRQLAPEHVYNPTTRIYEPTGRQTWHETVSGSYADTDYQGLGYRCEHCMRPVTLPDGVDEQGD